jgi:transposase InsO family protein
MLIGMILSFVIVSWLTKPWMPVKVCVIVLRRRSARTMGGGLLCAVKDAFSGRIVGYSIDSCMRAGLAVAALESVVCMRGNAEGSTVHLIVDPNSAPANPCASRLLMGW